jgi:DNA-directed RNA polymerase specialized sigma24 family protein
MSDPQRSGGLDGLPPNGAAPWHRSAHGAPEPAACRALARLYADHYGTLVRLAALLTGDAGSADEVAVDAFVSLCSAGPVEADDRALSYLQRQIVIRSRRAARRGRTCTGTKPPTPGAGPGTRGCPDDPGRGSAARTFHDLPMVLGLMTLRPAEREAVVLTSYLDLPEQQAAATAGVSPTALRRDLARATEALRDRLPAPDGVTASPQPAPRLP